MISRIKFKNDTASNWASSDVPLAAGEPGYDTDNKVLKIGDGSTLWADLPEMGKSTDAGVTWGQFCGNDTGSVSICTGSAKAKKLLIFATTTGTLLMEAKGIFALTYDIVTGRGSLTYQGASTGYIGRQDESSFSVVMREIIKPDGTTSYVYDIDHTNTDAPRLFRNGLTYTWYCIAHDVPANYESTGEDTISGSFFGDGGTIATFYAGVDSVSKIYIACTPSAATQVLTDNTASIDDASSGPGAIYAMVYDATTENGYITYQGASKDYINAYPFSDIVVSINNGYLTIQRDTGYAKFMAGVEYHWIVSTDGGYTAPSGSRTITENGPFDVTSLAQVVVNVASSGGSADFTKMKTGSYVAPSSDTLLSSSISFNCGFKPRVFVLMIQGTGTPQMDDNTNMKVTSSFMVADEDGNNIYAGTNFVYKHTSNATAPAGYTENEKNVFYTSTTGVYGGAATDVYLKAGATYNWFALR